MVRRHSAETRAALVLAGATRIAVLRHVDVVFAQALVEHLTAPVRAPTGFFWVLRVDCILAASCSG